MKWKKKAQQIPSKVSVHNGINYEVMWVKDLNDDKDCGECRFGPRMILINKEMGPKLTYETYFHEFLHALSAEHGINLTESQILKFETTLPYLTKFFNNSN